MLKRTEVGEQVYKGVSLSKTIKRSYSNCYGHSRKKMGVGDNSPTNPEKGRADKCKKINAENMNNNLTIEKHAWYMALDTTWRGVNS